MKKYDVLVIGGGPSGITISKALGGKMSVGVIRPEDHSMIYCAMPYVIEGILPVEKTFKKDELVTGSGADLIRDKVAKVLFEEKKVVLESGGELSYEKLIIATGAAPILPPIEGVDLAGVFTFKTEYDLVNILGHIRSKNVRNAVVVGAGAIGIELAQAFKEAGLESHLIDMAGHILPNLIDADFARQLQEAIEARGIIMRLNSKVSALKGNGAVESMVLDRGEEIDLPGGAIVVFSVGVRANVELFKGTGLEIGPQGIVVDNQMRTNIPDVYAVGDCVQFVSAITGKPLPGKLATNAVPMARMLAKNLLGDNRRYKGFYNGAATKVADYFVGGTGLTESALAKEGIDYIKGEAELATMFPIMPGARKIRAKLLVRKDNLKIVGAQIVSGTPATDKVDIVTLAMQSGLTAMDMAAFSYSAQPYQAFFPANNVFVASAEQILSKAKK